MKHTEQSSFRRFFASRLFLVVIIIILVLLVLGYVRAYYQDYLVRQQISYYKEEASKLESKKFELVNLIKYAMSPEFAEDKARTELNMKKPGENVLLISNPANSSSEANIAQPVDKKILSNVVKWWYYFTSGRDPESGME